MGEVVFSDDLGERAGTFVRYGSTVACQASIRTIVGQCANVGEQYRLTAIRGGLRLHPTDPTQTFGTRYFWASGLAFSHRREDFTPHPFTSGPGFRVLPYLPRCLRWGHGRYAGLASRKGSQCGSWQDSVVTEEVEVQKQ